MIHSVSKGTRAFTAADIRNFLDRHPPTFPEIGTGSPASYLDEFPQENPLCPAPAGRSSEYKFKFKGPTPIEALQLVVDDYLDDSNDFMPVSFYNQIVSSLRFGWTRRQAVLEARDQCWRDDRIQALVRFRQSFDLEVDYVIAAINLGATQAMWTALTKPRRNAT